MLKPKDRFWNLQMVLGPKQSFFLTPKSFLTQKDYFGNKIDFVENEMICPGLKESVKHTFFHVPASIVYL